MRTCRHENFDINGHGYMRGYGDGGGDGCGDGYYRVDNYGHGGDSKSIWFPLGDGCSEVVSLRNYLDTDCSLD